MNCPKCNSELFQTIPLSPTVTEGMCWDCGYSKLLDESKKGQIFNGDGKMPDMTFLCLDCDEELPVEGKDIKEIIQKARDAGWFIDLQENEFLCSNCK